MKLGRINLILGCMFSGKTTELISRYNRYTIGGKKCIMVKHKFDSRYSEKEIVTHDNIKVNAVICENLYEIERIIINYEVICIDEIQFYDDAPIMCDKWASEGKVVEACGLNGTYKRTEFSNISKLVPLVSNITYKTAICRETGEEAIYTYRIVEEEGEILIGGDDMYKAVDRETYYKDDKKERKIERFREFIGLYAKINKRELTIGEKNRCIEEYKHTPMKVYEEIIKKVVNV